MGIENHSKRTLAERTQAWLDRHPELVPEPFYACRNCGSLYSKDSGSMHPGYCSDACHRDIGYRNSPVYGSW